MGLSTYTANKLLELQVGKTAFTLPTVYVALSTTAPTAAGTNVTEPATGSYARVATSGATWGSAVAGSISNAAAVTFPAATADWSAAANMAYFVFYDAASAGNMLGFSAITTPKAILNGDTAKFDIGQVTITLA